MTTHTPNQAIGIYDSGIGGLAIARTLTQALPQEHIVYFGDTAHLPYGDKSAAAIQAYSVKIAHMLLQQRCKLILIACHSASAAAFDLVKEYVASHAHVINVIDPVIAYLKAHYAGKKVGLIGTKQTVNSGVYQKKLSESDIVLQAQATPLLASAIEENFANPKIIDDLLEEYLSHDNLQNIDALVLGCTHYPVIKERIANFYQQQVDIIDAAEIVTAAVKHELQLHQLLNQGENGSKHCYISDYTEAFAATTKLFFDEEITLEHCPLWE